MGKTEGKERVRNRQHLVLGFELGLPGGSHWDMGSQETTRRWGRPPGQEIRERETEIETEAETKRETETGRDRKTKIETERERQRDRIERD